MHAALELPESDWPKREQVVRSRLSPEQEKRLEALKQRRDRVAAELQLDPGVLAPKQALERLVREPDAINSALMRWQRTVLGL